MFYHEASIISYLIEQYTSRSRESDESVGVHMQGLTTRVTMVEEANKALLEEVSTVSCPPEAVLKIDFLLTKTSVERHFQIYVQVYRLQSNVRAAEVSKKEAQKEGKRNQHDLMETLRSSNDVISQLTARLRKAEEKLHRERENVQSLHAHSKKLEQASELCFVSDFIKTKTLSSIVDELMKPAVSTTLPEPMLLCFKNVCALNAPNACSVLLLTTAS